MTGAQLPDLVVGLIRVHDARGRSADEGAELVPNVAELTAIVHNQGNGLAEETTTRFWVRGADIDRELRVIYTPVVPQGEEIEVTALWDIRGCRGEYVITVTADAFGQIVEVRKDNNSASVHVVVRDTRVDLD
ncbi:MAG TPA: CARDB domain-containing protein [Propionibacteriaceae bacterium]|nr:CARDB domain-containing protein [Propionibacteriaceae bacterium]